MNAAEAIEYLKKKCDSSEPVFIIRGQDELGFFTVMDWMERARRAGVNETKIENAGECAVRMVKWAKKKRPD